MMPIAITIMAITITVMAATIIVMITAITSNSYSHQYDAFRLLAINSDCDGYNHHWLWRCSHHDDAKSHQWWWL